MDLAVTKGDIADLGAMIKNMQKEQRKNFEKLYEQLDEINLQSKEIREEIGYQTLLLKILADNIDKIQFDADTGISSKIEISIGAQILGCGAKLVYDIDTSKTDYHELLKNINSTVGVPEKVKKMIKSKIESLS